MFTLIFLLISLVPFGMAALIYEGARDCDKWEACKPTFVGILLLIIGIYLDYHVLLN